MPTYEERVAMFRAYLIRVRAGLEGPPTGGETWEELQDRCLEIADAKRQERDPSHRGVQYRESLTRPARGVGSRR